MSNAVIYSSFLLFFKKSKYIQSNISEMRKWKNFILKFSIYFSVESLYLFVIIS